MQWTMPHRVLQIVASLIVLAAVSSFVMGLLNAPQRGGRLPGEKAPGVAGTGAAIEAQDATPLSNERIEGPPPPAANDEAKDEDKAEADAGNSDADEAAASAAPPVAAGNQTPQLKPLKPPPMNGEAPEQTLGGPPAPDEPPH
jgi:hypothetical protein